MGLKSQARSSENGKIKWIESSKNENIQASLDFRAVNMEAPTYGPLLCAILLIGQIRCQVCMLFVATSLIREVATMSSSV